MKKTFTTQMPDQAGAFLAASRAVSQEGGNITRVSYNKAVDAHMLFLEVEGEEEKLIRITGALERLGYLKGDSLPGRVILLEFHVEDHPGAITPVLELINSRRFNISYISSQENGRGYQDFRMGLFIENAEEIARKIGLGQEEAKELMVDANRIMQLLDEQDKPPYKTFDYIGQFADMIRNSKGERFGVRISQRALKSGTMVVIEPPCGSNTYVLERNGKLLFIDSGFACYRGEMLAILRQLFEGFDTRERVIALTHGDMDHCGLLSLFDRIYVGERCYENFRREREEEGGFREENRLHAPYCRIARVLTGYRTPVLSSLQVIGKSRQQEPGSLSFIGSFSFEGLTFEAYEGSGGHVEGETVFLCPEERLVFTGDIFVNLKGFTKAQAAFNQLAPFLMSSVDTDPKMAAAERETLFAMLSSAGGSFALCPGHGAVLEYPTSAAERR